MSSTERNRINWRQAAGEALLIFVGVLVALMGQAWWEDRADRVLVEQHSANLLQEIESNLAGFDRIISRREATVDQGTTLLRLMAVADPRPVRDSILAVATAMMAYNTFNPATAALENLTGSGDLGLFEDPGVRLAISEYARALHHHNEKEAELLGFRWGTWFPLGARHLALLGSAGVRNRMQDAPARSRVGPDFEGLMASREFENMLVINLIGQIDGARIAQRARDRAEELRVRLAASGAAF